VTWSSAGAQGFKGSRKGTPYAAQIAADVAAKKAINFGMRQIDIYVKGPGAGRESAIRALQAAGLEISLIHKTFNRTIRSNSNLLNITL